MIKPLAVCAYYQALQSVCVRIKREHCERANSVARAFSAKRCKYAREKRVRSMGDRCSSSSLPPGNHAFASVCS